MGKIKEYLKMDEFFGEPLDGNDISNMYMFADAESLNAAAHAINSHDELVNQRNELLKALEAHEKFWTIRESELGELSPEARAVRDAGLAVITKTKGNTV